MHVHQLFIDKRFYTPLIEKKKPSGGGGGNSCISSGYAPLGMVFKQLSEIGGF